MRVIAGHLGGRRLLAPEGQETRPTPDRVREALFSSLETWLGGPGSLEGARGLDLYAGSGALGIELLSRGGESVTFVERSPDALSVLEKNLEQLEVEGQSTIARGDVYAVLGRLRHPGPSFDVVFLDPPYAVEDTDRILARVRERDLLISGGIAVVEHSSRREPEGGPGYEKLRTRRYGTVAISFYRALDAEPQEDSTP